MVRKNDPTRVQENKVVMAKLPRDEYVRFQHYFEQRKENSNAVIRRLILTEIDKPTKDNLAGKNIFRYHPTRDTFSWQVILDDDTLIEVVNDLSPAFIEQLSVELEKAQDDRNQYLKKKNEDSVPIPKQMRGTKE